MAAMGCLHSLVGWGEFQRTPLAPHISEGLKVLWHFAGVAMVTFGVITIVTRDRTTRLGIGAMYVLFSIGCTVFIRFGAALLLMFCLPGLMVLIGSFRS